MKVLVFGASGMLGNAMIRKFSESARFETFGTLRSERALDQFAPSIRPRLITGVDVENHDSLVRIFNLVRPDLVVNCVGLVKQLTEVNDPLVAVPVNSLLPHKMARLAELVNARMIQVSTDCVFSGKTGFYSEDDTADASDVYGRSKLMGEIDYPNCVTLRTSIIGHELFGHRSLVGWFLAQKGPVKGYAKAIFSGLPTVELASVVIERVLPHPHLRGLYHVAADPISKFDLLNLIAETYQHKIEIRKEENFLINRSLNATRFNAQTGYQTPLWRDLVERMASFR